MIRTFLRHLIKQEMEGILAVARVEARNEARKIVAQTPPGGQFDFPQVKIREIADAVVTDRLGDQQQFEDAVRSIVEDELQSRPR